jgi:hypothetical protein
MAHRITVAEVRAVLHADYSLRRVPRRRAAEGAAREFMGARALFINGRAASTWPRLVTAARALLKACR